MRGNEGVIGGCCGRHGRSLSAFAPRPWVAAAGPITDCVEEDRPVWRRPTPGAEEALGLWGRLRVCFVARCGGTDTMVPSMILSNACCTPSPETSRAIEGLSDLRLILSI